MTRLAYALKPALLLAVLFIASPLSAQIPGTWETNLGVPGISGNVFATAVAEDGTIYAAGDFTLAGEMDAAGIAMWDGITWQPLGTGLTTSTGSAIGYALLIGPEGDLYVGGQFQTAGGIETNNVARWDGEAWHDVGGGLTEAPFLQTPNVRALAFDSEGNLYVSGIFFNAGEVSATNVARWDGDAWHALGAGTNQSTLAIAVDSNDDVYFGGRFTQAGGEPASGIARWDGEAWHPLGSGLTLPFLTGAAFALAIDGEDVVYVGGAITGAGGNPVFNVAMWNGEDWSSVGQGLEGGTVLALRYDETQGLVYAGGRFTASGEQALDRVAAWDGMAWQPLGEGVAAEDSPVVYAFGLDDSAEARSLIVTGAFETAGGSSALGAARWVPATSSTEADGSTVALSLTGFPNPASSTATVSFSLPEAADVRLVVYDLLGRQVAVLNEGTRSAGSHDVTLDAGALAPGVYLVRLTTGSASATTRMTVVR